MNIQLKDEDVNISSKTNINCNFTNGFTLIKNNNTFNHKDLIGFRIIILIIFIIICSIYIILVTYEKIKNINQYKTPILIALIIGCIILIGDLFINPIHIVYIVSYLITITTKTPPYLDLDKYFPNHTKLENKETFDKIKLETKAKSNLEGKA